MGDARPTALRRQRVLAVEDDPAVSESFKTLLELLGNEVCAVMSGPAALDAARTFRPDIAFIDIDLPGVDGYEVAARLRAEHGPRIRLYALTGFARAADKERALSAGFDAHIVKPVDLEALKELLAGNQPEPESGTQPNP